MADEGDGYSGRFVERRLEREQREHPMDRPSDRAQPLAAPRPDRRADEVETAHAGALQLSLETEIEVGGVDADEHRNALGHEAPEAARAGARRAPAGAR